MSTVTHPVLSALTPVALLIAVGFIAGYAKWIRGESIKDLSNLVFLILTPALMFRTMSTVHMEQLDFKPVAAYFLAALVMYALVLLTQGLSRRSAVLAMASTFSNSVMIGVPLIGLAYGAPGLVIVFTLLSLHSVVMLTAGTLVLELAVSREMTHERAAQGPQAHRPVLTTVLVALRNSIIHPVAVPVIAGLLFAQTGWGLPELVDKPLQWLGTAFGPMALLLVGATLSNTAVGTHLRGALLLTVVKTLVYPLTVLLIAKLFGLSGLSLMVIVVVAGLPIGANVFLFSQRYKVAQELVTASVIVSTALAMVTVPLVMVWVAGL
jgi:malonate transporter and related proteins